MQKKTMALGGLRLLLWGAILLLMIMMAALLLDRREPISEYRDAVLVSGSLAEVGAA